jgi:hypothetical protein
MGHRLTYHVDALCGTLITMSRPLVSFVSFCHNTHATMSSTLGYDVPNTSILRSSSAGLVQPCLGAMGACWNLDYLEPEPGFCKYLGSIQCQHLIRNWPPQVQLNFFWMEPINIPVPILALLNPRTNVRFMGRPLAHHVCGKTTPHGGQGKFEPGFCKHPNSV